MFYKGLAFAARHPKARQQVPFYVLLALETCCTCPQKSKEIESFSWSLIADPRRGFVEQLNPGKSPSILVHIQFPVVQSQRALKILETYHSKLSAPPSALAQLLP